MSEGEILKFLFIIIVVLSLYFIYVFFDHKTCPKGPFVKFPSTARKTVLHINSS